MGTNLLGVMLLSGAIPHMKLCRTYHKLVLLCIAGKSDGTNPPDTDLYSASSGL